VGGASEEGIGWMQDRRTFASLSAARWAYIVGWRDTLSMERAWGRAEREQERLGRAMSRSGGIECWAMIGQRTDGVALYDRISPNYLNN
jgi:hypothetical protein